MIQIKPVSELRKKFPDIEKTENTNESIYLTKNGYDTMEVLNLEAYSNLTDGTETILDEADFAAKRDNRRYTHDEIFDRLRRRIND